MQRYNQRLVEEMKNKQTQERVRLPKIQRSEAKTRMAMFKKSLRITAAAAITPEQEREKIKQVRKLWIGMGLCAPVWVFFNYSMSQGIITNSYCSLVIGNSSKGFLKDFDVQ